MTLTLEVVVRESVGFWTTTSNCNWFPETFMFGAIKQKKREVRDISSLLMKKRNLDRGTFELACPERNGCTNKSKK